MAKKKKLNSKNPKWNKNLKEKEWSKKILMKENKLFKLYFCYE
tara:strand:- start:568 stop:696 length:129 start_codon:yes stop_codon:yes gene_type:complete